MPPRLHSTTSVISLTNALRQCRLETQQVRWLADVVRTTPADPLDLSANPFDDASDTAIAELVPVQPRPFTAQVTPGFRSGLTTRQNRYDPGTKKIREYPRLRSSIKACPDPIKVITNDQLKVLDPTGAREHLFNPANPESVKPGDILQVRLKSGEPFSGVCLTIRQIHSKVDWAFLLRNNLTRINVEMWFKIFSPNIEGIEIVQRKAKRARRVRLFYMRKPKHDIGSVETIVRQYNMAKAGIVIQKKGAKKGSKKR